jgi:hypothetical protein
LHTEESWRKISNFSSHSSSHACLSYAASDYLSGGSISRSRRDAIFATHNRTVKSARCLVYIVNMPIQVSDSSEYSLAVWAFLGAVLVSHVTSA